ncbi:peptidase U32 family protein [Ammoniphilus resinae]|uniref:Protease n=1 Tax=Ammoniphilus resinae TaxID=861532 RepID=A0ABS4GLW6_9BACL|nr:peptidase U32 family protein [Ammoniphilus resinae]MBP1931239.1 putative protease [Ammoniphilus resinae]
MTNKTELVVSAGSVEEVQRLFQAGADAVEIGQARYSLRMPGSFDSSMIKETMQIARHFDKKVYVSVNTLFHPDLVEELASYLGQLQELSVHAIIFGDPAVLMAARENAPTIPLHWSTETTSTSYRTVNYWGKKGASRAILARELSFEEVIGVKQNTTHEVQVQIHGMTCIFHSKRSLVSNYMDHRKDGRELDLPLYIKEDNRDDANYPIFQDEQGTHVMSAEDICMIEQLPTFIQHGFDALKIDGILKSAEYNETVVSVYRRAIDDLMEDPNRGVDSAWMEEIKRIQPETRPLGTGFYFKEQVY